MGQIESNARIRSEVESEFMRMTQCEVVNKLLRRGFEQNHRPLNDGSVVMHKRRAWEQVFAQVALDGTINGGESVGEFLKAL